jgi:transposase
MNATNLPASCNCFCDMARKFIRTHWLSANPCKSAASLNACFSAAYSRSSRYSSLTPLPSVLGFLVFFMFPTLYGQSPARQSRILFLTYPSTVRTLYDMEQGTLFDVGGITDGITAGVDARKHRGLEIAALARINRKDGFYIVPSVTNPRPTKYKVKYSAEQPTCTCEDHTTRHCRCKHIYAVEYFRARELNPDGSTTITEAVTVTKTRKTYPQNWTAYNTAQTTEKATFQKLLADLCKGLVTPEQAGRGQRRLAMSDAVFSAVFKIYCTMSARRFTSDLCDAQAKGYIDKVPHFNSVLNYLESEELTPILLALIEKSSLPLRSVESQFAVDSTGFAYSRFTRWYDIKYNRFTSEQQWVKAHICTGTHTNVITAAEIHDRDAADAPQLPSLVATTAKNFDVQEVSADKGYTGQQNHEAIAAIGATPFIMFKENATGGIGGLFQKMFHYFQFNKESFLAHYHRRSNVESTMMMVKTKFGDSVRSKTEIAAKNEVLAKFLCHNICCVIQSMHELGIEANFM